MAETRIVGRGLGGLVKVTTTDSRVVALLVAAEGSSFGHSCRRQGTSGTWWVGPQVLAQVEALLADGAE